MMPSCSEIPRRLTRFGLVVGLLAASTAMPLGAQSEPEQLDPILAAELQAVDEEIERRLRTRYAAIPGLEKVAVDASGGWIKLDGEVRSPEQIALASTVAEQEEAVLRVDNRLTVTSDVAQRFEPLLTSLWQRGSQLISALPLLLAALIIVLSSAWFGRWLSKRRVIERRVQHQPFILQLLRQAIRLITLGLGLLVALDLLGATALLGALLGTAGVAGIAFGFAFRDVAENYIAGILLSLRQPFSPKDFVIVDGHQGVVARLNSRATILLTPDGNHLRLPNAMVFKAVIVNYSRNPTRRFEFELGVATDTDLDRACEVAERTLSELPGVLDEPAPLAFVSQAGDSSIILGVQGWVDQREHDFIKLRSEALRLVMAAFERDGIVMPDPGLRVELRDRRGAEDEQAGHSSPDGPSATVTRRDLRPDHGVERVVDDEREAADNDLLRPDAPRE